MTARPVRGADERPLPTPTWLSSPFWEACRRHEFVLPRCDSCGIHFFIPEVVCPSCLSTEWTWTKAQGTGTVYSFTVVYRPLRAAMPTPYILAVIDLDEGCSMLGNLDASPADVHIGMRAEVTFVDETPEMTLPEFRPTANPVSKENG